MTIQQKRIKRVADLIYSGTYKGPRDLPYDRSTSERLWREGNLYLGRPVDGIKQIRESVCARYTDATMQCAIYECKVFCGGMRTSFACLRHKRKVTPCD